MVVEPLMEEAGDILARAQNEDHSRSRMEISFLALTGDGLPTPAGSRALGISSIK